MRREGLFALPVPSPRADDNERSYELLRGMPMPRLNRKGRSNRDVRHVRLYDHMLTCDAYLSLSCAARAVLIEIARIYDGTNNGRIALSVRTAAKRCRIADGTANRALDELTERGFIECVRRGSFGYKKRHASEWRITSKPCDVTGELSSKQFMRWRVAEYCQAKKQISVSKYDATVPPIDTVTGLANGSGR